MLKEHIDGQIATVQSDVQQIADTSQIIETMHENTIRACETSAEFAFDAFSRWLLIWPVLYLWLNSEASSLVSMNSTSMVQGQVGEWQALKEMALEIQVIFLNICK